MKEIYKKLFDIQEMKLVFERTAVNPFHKSKYCPLPKVWEKLEPVFSQKKLLCLHSTHEWVLKTTIYDIENDQEISTELKINSLEAQKMWSDITYFKRYNLGSLLNIITDDDTDWKQKTTIKNIFDKKKYDWLIKWSNWKWKEEIMQYVLKIKKDYEIQEELKEKLDLFVNWL